MVSIIVPVYNKEKVLGHCIESLIAQTYRNIEIIIVNDGSSDNSASVCKDYIKTDSRIKYYETENSGVSQARNKGFEMSHGEYIMCVDSDDYVEKNYVEEFIKAKEIYPDYDNIWCCYQSVSDYNKSVINSCIYNTFEEYSEFSIKNIMTLHRKNIDGIPWNKLFKSDLIKNNSLKMKKDISLGEDLIFNFEYLDCTNGKILVINKPLYNYYSGDKNSLSNKYYKNMLNIYDIINSIMNNYVQKWNCDEKEKTMYYAAVFMKYEVILQNTFSKDNKKSYFEKLKYNNNILKSEDFKTSFDKSDYKPHKLYCLAYKSNNYLFVRLIDRFFHLVDRIRGRK